MNTEGRTPIEDDGKRYRIVRMYSNPDQRSRTMRKGLTLEEAQKHCQDPKTSKKGVWFDGYEEMKKP